MTRQKRNQVSPGETKRNSSVESGDMYVGPGGSTFVMPKINADLIRKQSENKYIHEGITKQGRVLFKKRFVIHLWDTEEQAADPKGTASLNKMVKRPDVGLWYTIQRMHRNVTLWGPAPYNDIWDYVGNEYQIVKLNDFDPSSFANAGPSRATVRNRILPGICLNDTTGEIEYWQTKRNRRVEKLENVNMMVDPLTNELGGTSGILPLIPIISMLKHSWKRQMQILNKLGIFFIRITEPQGNDKEYAQKIQRNASTDVVFQLRGNMEPITLGLDGTGTALDTITELGMQVRNFFSPSDTISKDGTLIGGSSNPEYELYMAFIEGTHRWLEEECEFILDPFLEVNGFDDRYEIRVEIPDPTPDKSDQIRGLMYASYGTQSTTRAERRMMLNSALAGTGIDIAPLTPEQDAALVEEYTQIAEAGGALGLNSIQMQKAKLVVEAMQADGVDPYALIDEPDAKTILKEALGKKTIR